MNPLKRMLQQGLVLFDKEQVRSRDGGVNHAASAKANRKAARDEYQQAHENIGGAGLTLLAGPVGLPFVALAVGESLPHLLHAKGNEVQAEAHAELAKE